MCSDWVTLFRAVSGESQLRREKDEAGRAWGRRRADWSVFGISKRYQVAAGLGKTGNRELGINGCSKAAGECHYFDRATILAIVVPGLTGAEGSYRTSK